MLIQWFPGHMKKTKELIVENTKLVDVVIELLDARLPISSRNPDIDKLTVGKAKLILLNKADLADEKLTAAWVKKLQNDNVKVLEINSITGAGIKNVSVKCRELLKAKLERDKVRGIQNRVIRAMIVGIPNVGKSTFINKFVGKSVAKTGDKPGVTKNKQWIKIDKGFELLDTPGVLWPKFEDQEVAIKLAAIGSIKEEILDAVELATNLIRILRLVKPNAIIERYKLENIDELEDIKVLELIADKRKFCLKGGVLDIERAAKTILDEFQGGKLGRVTLDEI